MGRGGAIPGNLPRPDRCAIHSEIFFRMTDYFELPNDPIPENWGKRGRPVHIPTERNRNEVKLMLAFGWITRRITQALLIIGKPPIKYYFVELRQRDEARPGVGGV